MSLVKYCSLVLKHQSINQELNAVFNHLRQNILTYNFNNTIMNGFFNNVVNCFPSFIMQYYGVIITYSY